MMTSLNSKNEAFRILIDELNQLKKNGNFTAEAVLTIIGDNDNRIEGARRSLYAVKSILNSSYVNLTIDPYGIVTKENVESIAGHYDVISKLFKYLRVVAI